MKTTLVKRKGKLTLSIDIDFDRILDHTSTDQSLIDHSVEVAMKELQEKLKDQIERIHNLELPSIGIDTMEVKCKIDAIRSDIFKS